MPADFFIDVQQNMVFSKATGVFTYADALRHMDRLQPRPDFRPTMNQLFDGREVTDIPMTSDQVRELAMRTIFSPKSKRAFVIPSDLGFGMVRMFEAYRLNLGETGIRVYRDIGEALVWLGLPDEPDPKRFIGLSLPDKRGQNQEKPALNPPSGYGSSSITGQAHRLSAE